MPSDFSLNNYFFLQPIFPPKYFDNFSPKGGCSEGFRFFFEQQLSYSSTLWTTCAQHGTVGRGLPESKFSWALAPPSERSPRTPSARPFYLSREATQQKCSIQRQQGSKCKTPGGGTEEIRCTIYCVRELSCQKRINQENQSETVARRAVRSCARGYSIERVLTRGQAKFVAFCFSYERCWLIEPFRFRFRCKVVKGWQGPGEGWGWGKETERIDARSLHGTPRVRPILLLELANFKRSLCMYGHDI